MKKLAMWLGIALVVGSLVGAAGAFAQDEPAAGALVTADGTEAAEANEGSGGFLSVVIGGGALGILL